MWKRISLFALIITLCALMTGCLEIEERVSIEPAGAASSVLKLRLYLPKDKKTETPPEIKIKADEIGKGIEGFESATSTTREIFGQIVTEVTMKARSFAALAKTYNTIPRDQEKKDQQDVNVDQIFTEKGFYQLKNKGKTILITRTFVPGPQKKAPKDEQGMGDLVTMLMGSIKLRLTLELPADVVSSNAEEQEGRTLRWVIPLDYLSRNKVVLKAEIKATPELIKALF